MYKMLFTYCALAMLMIAGSCLAQEPGIWGDQHNDTYVNPILPGDFQEQLILRHFDHVN